MQTGLVTIPGIPNAESCIKALIEGGYKVRYQKLHTEDDEMQPLEQSSQSDEGDEVKLEEGSFELNVGGMTCKGCAATITAALTDVKGVTSVDVDHKAGRAVVYGEADVKECIEAIETFGYTASQKGASTSSPSVELKRENENNTETRKSGKKEKNIIAEQPPPEVVAEKNLETIELSISGMTCASCVNTIESYAMQIPHVRKINVNLMGKSGVVYYNLQEIVTNKLSKEGFAQSVASEISDLGYETVEVLRSRPGRVMIQLNRRHEDYAEADREPYCNWFSRRRVDYEPLPDMKGDKQIPEVSPKASLEEIKKLEGVNSVDLIARPPFFIATIDYSSEKIKARDIIQEINEISTLWQAQLFEESSTTEALTRKKEIEEYSRLLLISLIFAVPSVIIGMGFHWIHVLDEIMMRPLIPGVSMSTKGFIMWVLATPVQFYIGKSFYVNSWHSMKKLRPTMDVLICLGTSAAYFTSMVGIILQIVYPAFHAPDFFETAVALIAFVILGRYLENLAKARTSKAVTKLFGLQATEATLVKFDKKGDIEGETQIDVRLIEPGDYLKVIPGSKIPCDGIVTSGKTTTVEAMITGESMPVPKKVGDFVIGSTINEQGVIIIRATKVGNDTTLAQIIKLVQDAQATKGSTQELADKISGYFVPVVIAISLADFGIWYALLETGVVPQSWLTVGTNNFTFALLFGITSLVIACPCALGLATPTAVMVGTGVGAKYHVLIKGGEVLEKACKVQYILFDKTGTLTMGVPSVNEFKVVDGVSERKFWKLVGSAEADSEHPLGRCIAEYAKEKVGSFSPVTDFKAISGMGIRCTIKGSQLLIGNKRLMDKKHVSVPTEYYDMMEEFQSQGKTVMAVAYDSKMIGLISVFDEVRKDSKPLIAALRTMGIESAIVSGDNKKTVSTVAKELGITKVFAEVLPADKKDKVEELQKAGYIVAMVGDGINDAPALTKADVGIAVGSGTDVAMESASIVLMRTSLFDILLAIDISRKTYNRIKLNFGWAFVYNLVSIPIAAGVFFPLMLATIPPWVAGLAMALSSISVLLSSLLLKRYTPPSIWTEQEKIRKEKQAKRNKEKHVTLEE